jgi:Asp/Glu/hydantoin racemase
VSIEKIASIIGKRVPSVTSSPKSSKLLTVVVTNRKLTGSKWKSHDFQALAVEATYLKATKGIATLKTGDIAKSFPGT